MAPVPAPGRAAATRDRRSTVRFSLATPATYTIGRSHGTAVTCNISTGVTYPEGQAAVSRREAD